MYSIDDFNSAEEEMLLTTARVELMEQQQKMERNKANATLAKLDLQSEPVIQDMTNASTHLKDMKSRLLGPWIVSQHYSSGSILTLNGNDKCWDARGWLRIVKRDHRNPEWQWEVQIDGINGRGSPDSKNVVLGALVGPRKEDFEKQQRKTEKLLVEMGYILYAGQNDGE
jgi:hypothetical protein